MSKSNTFETLLLSLIFKGTTDSELASAAGSATDLYVSLHTADPGEAGDQSTNEVVYGSYARKAVARSGAGWVVTGNVVNPAATISFVAASSGVTTATHFGIGTAASGAGKLLYSGAITPNIAISTGVTPQLTTATNVTED